MTKPSSGSNSNRPPVTPFADETDLNSDALDIDFDDSLNLGGIVGKLLPEDRRPDVEFLRKLYNNRLSDGLSDLDSPRIPKVIHQVWLGSELPEKFRVYQQNWQRIHPDWDYKLWTDEDVADFEFGSRDLFDSTDCFGQKVDLLRVEIINRYGGLYVDVDYDCFKRLDIFHHAFDFYGTIRLLPGLYMRWPEIFKTPVFICSSLIGSAPGNPVLKDYLQRARNNMGDPDMEKLVQDLSPDDLKDGARISSLIIKARRDLLITYLPFYDAFVSQKLTSDRRVIAMPPTFFNPTDNWWLSNESRATRYFNETYASLVNKGLKPYNWKDIPAEAFTVHHSSASWI